MTDDERKRRFASIRVLIVGGVALHREGLVRVLGLDERFDVCGAVGLEPDMLARIRQASPDVVVLDIADPVEAARAIRETAPNASVVVIATGDTDDDDQIVRFAAVGVRAYIVRDASVTDFAELLVALRADDLPCCPQIASALMRHVNSSAADGLVSKAKSLQSVVGRLTPREQQIVALIAEGRANKEIAQLLSIELTTVKTHVHHILDKLKLTRRGEIAALAQGM